jgi:hypothetical protein
MNRGALLGIELDSRRRCACVLDLLNDVIEKVSHEN